MMKWRDLKISTESETGPFMKDFRQVMDKLKLERQVYHSGAIVRNDVRKLSQRNNMAKIANISARS